MLSFLCFVFTVYDYSIHCYTALLSRLLCMKIALYKFGIIIIILIIPSPESGSGIDN